MPQIHYTNCMKCGKPQTVSYPDVLCTDCTKELQDPNTSALEDYIAKLQRRIAELIAEIEDREEKRTS